MSDIRLCDRHGRDPETGVVIDVKPQHGCCRCCVICYGSGHTCPGCGDAINHGVGICLVCRNLPQKLSQKTGCEG